MVFSLILIALIANASVVQRFATIAGEIRIRVSTGLGVTGDSGIIPPGEPPATSGRPP